MCDICVMNAVKTKMLSRRDLFKGAAMAGAAAALGTTAATPASAGSHGGGPVDMSHTLSADFPTYFGEPGYSQEQLFKFADSGFNLFKQTINEHTGTHIDAPLHFSADGASVDEIPIEQLVAPLCVIDIAARAAEDPDAQVTPDDIKAWMAAHGDIPQNACVAMHSGWGGKTDTDAFRGFDGKGMHFPGFHLEATKMLMEETGATSMAVDTLSLDHGPSGDFATHYAWLPTGRFGIENMANLDKVPAAGATLVIGAPKHKGGSGGPARIIALV
ncbi:cyclase family protein [Alisedimentitalea sp. MJ-SS2]|uniref:cyclase family protein n=1 Tax=Aliisedimentitalea sp. MJ-SS2 TaxID=3049795 RepID=UPI002914A74D|nr:cyclase family protein [Alisedimentitalea sp. MJ-SS2]MDU8929315.1 cyclase family protein [Alisedimentitalea sp. MJ-SS2]